MATVTKPIALDESFHTTEQNPRNIADVLLEGFSHITGRNASQVEYDNTESGLTADNVQDALDEMVEDIPTVPSVDIQTAVDEFETFNGGLLSSLKVSLTPNQDLHGYSEPWVGGAGKNKLPLVLADIKSANVGGTWSGNVYTRYGSTFEILQDSDGNVTGVKVGGTNSGTACLLYIPVGNLDGDYYFCGCANGGAENTYNVLMWDRTTSARVMKWDGITNSDTATDLTTPHECKMVSGHDIEYRIRVMSGVTVNDVINLPMIVNKTETDFNFAPYSNICPISGHTEVDIDVSDGEATQEQVTVNLGGTYYSGTLDVVTGVFTPDTASVEFDGSNDEIWQTSSGSGWHQFMIYGDSYNSTNIITNLFQAMAISERGQKTGIINYNDKNFRIALKDSDILITSVADWRTFLSNNPLQVNYELATPTPIQLSPTMVKALVGENHLSAPLDGQEITESKYKQMFTFDDVIAYIQSLS